MRFEKLAWWVFLATSVVSAQDPPAVVDLSVSGGRPGARVEAHVTASVTFDDYPYLVFAFPDGALAPAPAETLSDGTLSLVVPYVPAEGDGPGYRVGPCSIGVLTNDGAFTGGVDFEIRELPEVPDALDRFREIVSTHATRNRIALAAQQARPDLSEMTDLLSQLGDAQERNLLRLADQLVDNDTAQQTLDPLNGSPEAPTFEISRRLIGHFVAVYQALQESFPPAEAALNKAKQLARSASSSNCIFDALGGSGSDWDKCIFQRNQDLGDAYIDAEDTPLWYTFHRAFAPTAVVGAPVVACANPSAKAIAPSVLVTDMSFFLEHYLLDCNLHPTRPSRLTAVSAPNPLPVGPAASVGNQGTQIVLRVEPPWTPRGAVYGLLAPHYNHVLVDFATKLAVGAVCGETVKKYLEVGQDIFKTATPTLIDAVTAIQNRGPKFREAPLYKCDVQDIRPLYNDTLQRVPNQDDDSKLRWGLEGVRAGTMDVVLTPLKEHFPRFSFTDNPGDPCAPPPVRGPAWEFGNLFYYEKIAPCVKVETVGGRDELGVRAAYIFSYDSEGPHNPKTYNPPVLVGDPWSLESNENSASASANIQRISATKWVVTQKSTGAPSSVRNVITTWNRLDLNLVHRPGPRKISIKVKSDVAGTCQGLDASLGTIVQEKDGNNGCAADWTLATYAEETGVTIRFTVLGGAGPGFGPGHGTVTTEIEYLPDSPPQ